MTVKVIEISVSGPTSSGKSHVMNIIEKALIAEYGPHTQVASYDLSLERNSTNDWHKPSAKNTVFVLSEVNN
ncbi:hypothetical protein [Yersinia mollaretii]|uniref:hypothetical protein n=1 Tax=Yersinia mollaretii TaxID=33060 RepID=UPI0011A6B146|nr:hypothetical protein [Yersinia mollaretii]